MAAARRVPIQDVFTGFCVDQVGLLMRRASVVVVHQDAVQPNGIVGEFGDLEIVHQAAVRGNDDGIASLASYTSDQLRAVTP
jgi:hypothetical protein